MIDRLGAELLERAFPAPADLPAGIVALRRRRAKVRRAAVLALVVLLLAPLVAALAWVRSVRTTEPAGEIDRSNVGTLGLAWYGPLGATAASEPVVAGDRVFVAPTDGSLVAFSTACASPCEPLWTSNVGRAGRWSWGWPAVDGGRVYMGASNGRLLGFPISCDQDPCRPTWVGRAPGDLTSAAPVSADGYVFVASTAGRLYALSESCSDRRCEPAWTARLPGGFLGATPVVGDHVLYAGSSDGVVSAYPTRCSAVHRVCRPLWTATVDPGAVRSPLGSAIIAPLRLTPSTLFVASGSRVYAFPTSCNGGSDRCEPSWTAEAPGWINQTADDGEGIVAASSVSFGGAGRVSSFAGSCGSPCEPTWSVAEDQWSNPVVNNGVLFVGGDGLKAYDIEACHDVTPCSPAWSAPIGSISGQPTVVGDTVYVATDDGTLFSFRPGASEHMPASLSRAVDRSAGGRGAGAPRGLASDLAYLGFYGLVAVGLVAVVVRGRRRSRS